MDTPLKIFEFSYSSGFSVQSREALLADGGHHGQRQRGPGRARAAAGGDEGERGAARREQAQSRRRQREGPSAGEGAADGRQLPGHGVPQPNSRQPPPPPAAGAEKRCRKGKKNPLASQLTQTVFQMSML